MLDVKAPDHEKFTHGEEYQELSLKMSPATARNVAGTLKTRKLPHGWFIVPSVVIGATMWAVVLL